MSTQSYAAWCSINFTLYLFMNNFNTGKQIQFVCYEINQTSFKHQKKDAKTDIFSYNISDQSILVKCRSLEIMSTLILLFCSYNKRGYWFYLWYILLLFSIMCKFVIYNHFIYNSWFLLAKIHWIKINTIH